MPTKVISERASFSGGKVRRDGAYPVVLGVLLCGATSKQGRSYLPAAFAGDRVKRYEGRACFVNHDRGDRTAESKLGEFENCRLNDRGLPVGDLAVNPKHPLAESVLWAAEHKPGFYGMSHMADCATRYEGGKEVVEEVREVLSVDLVANPATTRTLYESAGGKPVLIKEYFAALAPRLTLGQTVAVKRLAEMDDLGAAPMPPEAPAAGDTDTDPDTAISAGFEAALMAVIKKAMAGGMDPKAALAKIKTLLASHGDATDSGDDAPVDDAPAADAGDAPPPDPKKDESVKRLDSWTVLAECDAAGYRPTPTQLKALSLLPDAADRKAFVAESMAQASGGAEKVRSASRHQADRLAESAGKGKANEPPADPKELAKWITEAD